MTKTHEEIKVLLSKISADGKWTYSEFHAFVDWGEREPDPVWEIDGPDWTLQTRVPDSAVDNKADAELIANAPDIIAQLLDEVAALQDRLDKLNK